MRILSQDGTFDVPYEMVVIQRFENNIYYLNKNLTGVEGVANDLKLAEYSTEEKAQKAMEMLQKAYMSSTVYKAMPTEQKAICLEGTSEEEQEILFGIFQFLADDEIEV